ncbi:hypothetical protein ACG04Q_19005 [Roseateles sp. DXS20W]|uniref:Uncharacterized protein n=1 Tax=Pelomonas lactea TaxID=3299030 RepID=A0ABW7GNX3_9BURK
MKALLPLMPLLLAAAPAFATPATPASCPAAGDQLADALDAAKRRVGRDAEVRVLFEVGADGRARLVNLQGSRQYQTPVRLAVGELQCQPGTPQQYVLDIRFAEPARGPSTRWAGAASR